MTNSSISVETVLRDLEYIRDRGEFVWKITQGRKSKGAVAGWTDVYGYRLIRINGRLWRVHHLVYLVETGALPKYEVDHIDGNPANNVYSNLRDCVHSQNLKNMKRHKDNKSGFKGVTWHDQRKKWMARITVDGISKSLGLFLSKHDAAIAYNNASIEFHGAFSKLNGV